MKTIRVFGSLGIAGTVGLALMAFSAPSQSVEVSGNGKDLYPGDTNPFSYSIRFAAEKEGAKGKVEGTVIWKDPNGGLISKGRVNCLEVRGNRMYLTYIATGGGDPSYGAPGNTILLGFQDNDGKKKTLGDGQTYIYFITGTADGQCIPFADFTDGGGGFPVKWTGPLEIDN